MEGSSEDDLEELIVIACHFQGGLKKESEVNGNVLAKTLCKCLFCTEANI